MTRIAIRRLGCCLFLAALVSAAYLPVLWHDFVRYDDDVYITHNAVVRAGLSWQGLKWAFTHPYASNWHPLTWLSHMLDCQLFGLRPAGHHAMNAAVHTLAVIAFFLVLARMIELGAGRREAGGGDVAGRDVHAPARAETTIADWPALAGAAIFAVHPLRVESVAWAAERKDTLSALFWFLTIAAYLGFAERRSCPRYGLVILCFAAGLLAKGMLVVLPLVLLLIDRWPLDRWRPGRGDDARPARTRLILEKLPLMALAVAVGVVTFRVQATAGSVRPFDDLPLVVRLATVPLAYASYLKMTIWPFPMAVFYPHPGEAQVAGWLAISRVVVAAGFLLLVSAAALAEARKRPYLLTGWGWFLLAPLPVIGLLQAGDQWIADRFSYLAQPGLIVAAAAFAADQRWSVAARRVALATAATVVGLCIAGTWVQLRYWRDTRSLFEQALAVVPGNFVAHINLGNLEFEAQHPTAAEAHYRAALAAKPSNPEATTNLAAIHLARNELDEVEQLCRQVWERNPQFAQAAFLLALVARARQDLGQAEELLEQVLVLQPQHVAARIALAELLARHGKTDQARQQFLKILWMDPGSVPARIGLAEVLLEQGSEEEAIAQCRRALQLAPRESKAQRLLAQALLQSGQPSAAVEHLRVAEILAPNDAAIGPLLAEALRSTGRDREALVVLREQAARFPDDTKSISELAWILATHPDAELRSAAEALTLARIAADRSSTQPEPRAWDAMAAAHAEQGKFAAAIHAAQRGIEEARQRGEHALATAIESRLEQYRAGHPYREQRP